MWANMNLVLCAVCFAIKDVEAKSPYTPKPIVDPGSLVPHLPSCHRTLGPGTHCALGRICVGKDGAKYHGSADGGECEHKGLWPMIPIDLLLTLAMFLIGVAAAAAGIGGGGINVPALMYINNFLIEEAVPLSHVAVFGNATAQLIINTRKMHPEDPLKPVIDYTFALICLPMILGGNSLGIVVSRAIGPSMLVLLSTVLLIIAAYKTLCKGIQIHRKSIQDKAKAKPARPESQQTISESARSPRVAQAVAASGRSGAGNLCSGNLDTIDPSPALSGPSVPAPEARIHRSWSGTNLRVAVDDGTNWPDSPRGNASNAVLLEANARDEQIKRDMNKRNLHVVMAMIMFQILFIGDFLALSSDVSHVKRCSALYWVALLCLYPVIIAATTYGVKQVRAEENARNLPQEQRLTTKTLLGAPSFALAVGLIAGLLGLGGGELMVPMLLFLGMHPMVASATSGFMIFFSTSTNIVHYLVAGTLEPFLSYALFVGILAFSGALLGLRLRYSKTVQNRIYLVVYLLVVLLVASCSLLLIRGLIVPAIKGEVAWTGSGFCSR